MDSHHVRIPYKTNDKQYRFDQVFNSDCDQATVFKRTRMDYLIRQVVSGFHATVFVYGQTGSGKTFTMDGYQYQVNQRNQ